MRPPAMVAPSLLRDAAERFIRVRTAGEDSPEHAEWLAWIDADPAHRQAFAQIQQAWDVTGAIESPPWPRAEELQGPPVHARWRSRRVRAAAAGIAAVVATAGLVLQTTSFEALTGKKQFATARGEQKSTVLSDGSRIELGGQTAVAVKYTPAMRLVVAAEGEAFYNVAADPKRPFVVEAGPIKVTALGTAFSVRREGETVSVAVSDGTVEVSCETAGGRGDAPAVVTAQAGERIRFDRGRILPLTRLIPAQQATAWRQGRLRFEDEPLRVVVATLNRYSSRGIVLADPALGELKFTGTVFDDRVDDWLAGIPVVFPVRVEDAGRDRVRIVRD